MSRIILGVICGTAFGLVSVGTMIPLKMEDKKRAMLSAFLHRFGIGFVVCNVSIPWPGWVSGLVLGCFLSLPDAIITKAYIPIIVLGTIGGTIIGLLVN
jgi:hypothetical protein